jgi:p-aminobenzoyl-glutamate transporter AbgT
VVLFFNMDPGSGKKLFRMPDPWGPKRAGSRIRNTVHKLELKSTYLMFTSLLVVRMIKKYYFVQVVQPHLTKMSDRKAELERKKAKLAQIRAEKEARRKEREALESQTAAKVRRILQLALIRTEKEAIWKYR